jgi:hypothetical protein
MALLLFVILALSTLPGYALLALTGAWRDWRGWQRFCLAVGVSLSLYPALYYFARWVAPGFGFQPWMWWGLLVLSAAAIGADWLRRRPRLHLPEAEALAFGVILLLTFLSRAWIAWEHPYPAWTDSLHHTLATALTAAHGRLPTDLNPYFDTPFSLYHLGLYAITGTVAQTAGAPAHSALLWTAQLLNTYAVLGVFLVLDRHASRTAALIGALTVGLLAHQPAFYVNWGRFTQLSAQTVFLMAWAATIAVMPGPLPWQATGWRSRLARGSEWFLAALLTAAVFMLHFRVAAFYLLLLGPTVIYFGWRAWRGGRLGSMALATGGVGLLALLLVSPLLWGALSKYIGLHIALAQANPLNQTQMNDLESRYFVFGFDTFPSLVARPWLLAVGAISAVIGLLRRNWIAWLCTIWVALLMLLGNAWLLPFRWLEITNLGAVLIMLYAPLALVVGAASDEVLRLLPLRWAAPARRLAPWAVVLLALPFTYARARDVEPYRYFVTDADVRAMQWINANTPPDAAFAINTAFWLPTAPLGTDAGYWIPYFTQRRTNTGVMLANMADQEQVQQMLALSHLADDLDQDPTLLARLRDLGYRYVYIGAQGNYNGGGLDADSLLESGLAARVYQDGPVSILRILDAP